jgi:AraC-like DNA-binding protein
MEHYHFYPNQQKLMNFKPKLIYSGLLNGGPEWRNARHRHNFCEIMVITAGAGAVKTDAGELAFRQGDVVVYNTGFWHEEYCTGEKLSMMFFAIENIQLPGIRDGCLIPRDASPVIDAGSYDEVLKNLLAVMVSELQEKPPYYKAISTSIATLVVYYILRLFHIEVENCEHTVLCQDAKRFIRENYKQELTLDMLASHFHISKYYFLHTFKEIADISPMKYLLFIRMEEAKKLLGESDCSIAEVAETVGFQNSSSFSRVFKKSESITPAEYRGNIRGKNK